MAFAGGAPRVPASEPPFDALAASVLTGRFFGVPFFRPSIDAARLFDVWAYLLGPFAFFCFGLWRKGLLLLAVGLFLYAPLILPSDVSPLVSVLAEAYSPYGQMLEGLSLVFVLLFCLGRNRFAVCALAVFSAVFVYGALQAEPLYLGPEHGLAYVWFAMGTVWKAFFQSALAAVLGLRFQALVLILLAGAGLRFLGFPLELPLASLPAAAFPVFCGMMATYDRYRKAVLGETFWW